MAEKYVPTEPTRPRVAPGVDRAAVRGWLDKMEARGLAYLREELADAEAIAAASWRVHLWHGLLFEGLTRAFMAEGSDNPLNLNMVAANTHMMLQPLERHRLIIRAYLDGLAIARAVLDGSYRWPFDWLPEWE